MAPTERSQAATETERMLTEVGFHLTDEGRERARRTLAAAETRFTDEERETRRQALLARLNGRAA